MSQYFSEVSGGTSVIPTTFTTDSGNATPSSNVLNVLGGVGITTSGSGNTVTITNTGGGFTWNVVTTTTQTIAGGNGYIANNASLITFTLPSTCSVGDAFTITGLGAGGWKIDQNAGQQINWIDSSTTTGTGGSLASTNQYDTVEIICVVANTEFNVIDAMGNITIV